MIKQISLAVLAATFIAGYAGIASAEGGISSAASDESSSAALEADYAATHGNAVISGPSASTNAYGYVRENGLDRPHKQAGNTAPMKHYN